jgi:2-desacetyl-2-hydroxyethyl bacteriochlorophyllide A dehydrogenase
LSRSTSKIPVKSLYFEGPGRVKIRESSISGPNSGEVAVKTLFSAISAGTESLVYRGEWPQELTVDESISSLRGGFSYPLKYGYAAVGRIIQIGENVSSEYLGKNVFSFNPHETVFLSRTDDLVLIPEILSPEAAVFLPTMETAVSLVMDGEPIIGEVVAIFGQGVVGLLTAAILSRMNLAKIVTFDKYTLRRRASLGLGADLSIDSTTDFGVDRFEGFFQNSLSNDHRTDLTYELSGCPEVLNQAVLITGFNGRIVLGSFYGSKKADIQLGSWFHRSRIKLISSQVSSIAPHWSGRWTKSRRLGLAFKMIEEIVPENLITHRINFCDADKAYRLIDEKPEDVLQVIFNYEET